jgi:hypothetical protein
VEISVLLPLLVAVPEQVTEQVPEQDRLEQDRLLLWQLLQML